MAAPPRRVIRGSPATSPVLEMVHFPLRTVPPFHACRTQDRVAICAQQFGCSDSWM